MPHNSIPATLSRHMPSVLRWGGAVAKRLRGYNIALGGKSSGSASTDALTLADLTIQELIVAALRDRDPIFRTCKIEAEEVTGDLARFATDSQWTLAIDPIDGTKQYRDKTGNGYAVMLHMRSPETVHYSLVFVPETGKNGTWVEVGHEHLVCGEDDPARPAEDVLKSFPNITAKDRPKSKNIYLIGFQQRDKENAELVTKAGLKGFDVDAMPGSIYDLMASGQFAGSLIHSPNIYDFPVSLHIARTLGGDALWVHNREPVHFKEMWLDERANMLRLPGIVACSADHDVLNTLCDLAKDWNPVRYTD